MNSWETSYQNLKDIWGLEPEYTLEQYRSLVKAGKILDLGIGEGRNMAQFAMNGHDITGVDVSKTALDRCASLLGGMETNCTLHEGPIESFSIDPNTYSLIVSTWSLNFMKKSDALQIVQNCLEGLENEGLLYIGVFSTEDPQMKSYEKHYECVDLNSYYIPERDIIKSYFDLSDLVELLDDRFEIICRKQDLSLDLGHGEEHYHGAIELVIRRRT